MNTNLSDYANKVYKSAEMWIKTCSFHLFLLLIMFFDLGFALQGFQGQNKWRNKHARFQHNTDKEREKCQVLNHAFF